MNIRLFAQPNWFPSVCNAASAGSNAVRLLAASSVVALHLQWQAEVERRRRRRSAEELRAMSNHTLRDIGVGRPAIDWVARDNS